MNTRFDLKDDPTLIPTVLAMVERGKAFRAECKLRKVRFLPRQVMRRVYADSGLVDGGMIKSKPEDFFVFPN